MCSIREFVNRFPELILYGNKLGGISRSPDVGIMSLVQIVIGI